MKIIYQIYEIKPGRIKSTYLFDFLFLFNYNFFMNSCCIIGHRKIQDCAQVIAACENELCDLIENKGVSVFNFGAIGEFNDLCYKILTDLKIKYPQIKMVMYSLNNEIAYTIEEMEEYLSKYNRKNKTFTYKCFDEIIYLENINEDKLKYAFVLRNKKLIDNSDYCMFYYRKNYILPHINGKSRNSGTKIAYEHAIKQKKKIIIV